ncbi:MAG: pantoate--beta-alanine ligase [Wenzhouxiangellaceae bacterium]
MATGPDSITLLDSPDALVDWRAAQSGPVHFVPTMGNLHAGHLKLVEHAVQDGAAVIASIFVNPTQFGPGEDFERYPRTLGEDLEALASAGCDTVWTPAVDTMYPLPEAYRFAIHAPAALADCLCGAHRPGHFDGVCSVVMRLLWQIHPERAVFGEKDYQQLLIIRRMVEDFSVPVAIDAAPTVREADGLALSSRNRYLTDSEREIAPALYRVLQALADEAAELGPGTFDRIRRSGMERLASLGFRPEYVELRNAETLAPTDGSDDRVFAAAYLGKARLIDNVAVTRQKCP